MDVIIFTVCVGVAYVSAVLKGRFEDLEFEEEIQQMYLERRSNHSPLLDQKNGLAGVEKSDSSQQSSDTV